MKNTFDYLILGSGISGMTLALLFASSGAKTAVIERAGAWGGAMQRFRRNGVPLDTGFHFTGNLSDSFGDMLAVLGIRDMVETAEWLKLPKSNKGYFLATAAIQCTCPPDIRHWKIFCFRNIRFSAKV